jgi:methylated-DNA-[protein]-cysteine S-methyltransferase
MSLRFRIFETSMGVMGIIASDAGLRHVVLPGPVTVVKQRIRALAPDAKQDLKLLSTLVEDIQQYCNGKLVTFRFEPDFGAATDFTRDVWSACAQIGYGQTLTYGELAARVGKPGAARAVGTAMAKNPLPLIVPCHRVCASGGRLGGYSGPEGVPFKQRLLYMEARATIEGGRASRGSNGRGSRSATATR